MAYTRLWSVSGIGTTVGLDTSGATLITIFVCQDTAGQGVSDSKSNSYSPLTAQSGASGANTTGRFYYLATPTVGAAHTFSSAVAYGFISAVGYSGNAASPLGNENGNSIDSPFTGIFCGSLTPPEDNCLVLAACGNGNTTSGYSIDGGFTIVESIGAVASVSYGGTIAELIQTTSTSAGPSIIWTGEATRFGVIASFKVAGGGGGATWPGYISPFGWN